MSLDSGSPYIGVKPAICVRSTPDLNSSLIDNYVQTGYDCVLISITNTQYREKAKKVFQKAKYQNEIKVPGPSIVDVNLFAGQHLNHTIGLISSWIELESNDDLISEFSKQVLMNELQYAKFIGLKQLIIAPPKDLLKLSNYSRNLQDALLITESHDVSISISLPICEEFQESSQTNDSFSTWDMWNSIRTSVDHNRRLKVSLALPKSQISLHVIERWFAEPVSHILISSSIFLINHKGYPVLSKPNQDLLHHFQLKKPVFLLHGLEKVPEDVNPSLYMQYINYIILRNQPLLSKIEKFAVRHNDVLLPPLQPLKTNLDDFTYTIFEEDNVKYEMYGNAAQAAITDMAHLKTINIAIVGAGKGGLIEAVYNSVKKLGMKSVCNITAIEKNNSAVIFLQKRNSDNWENSVNILNMDMRDWSPRESYNIIISELLGSFGCNELSPECLSSVEKYLDRSNGVFIPQSYTSYIAPVFTPKLFKKLKDLNDPMAFERQYVVKMLESCLCSTKINEAWSFEHPSPKNITLKRNIISTFKVRYKTVINGIAGFFTAKLYKDIEITIKPDSHTQDLISWFPIFFPLETPLYVSDDTELEITLSRETRDGKVWYVWGVESFMYLVVPGENSNELQMRVRTNVSKIHNHNGRGFAIGESLSSI